MYWNGIGIPAPKKNIQKNHKSYFKFQAIAEKKRKKRKAGTKKLNSSITKAVRTDFRPFNNTYVTKIIEQIRSIKLL